MSENQFRSFNIDVLIQQKGMTVPVYLKIANRYIKYRDEVLLEELVHLKGKGVQSVYILESDYPKMAAHNLSIQQKILNADFEISQSVIKQYAEDKSKLHSLFKDVGFHEEKLHLINSLNERTLSIVKNIGSLNALLEKFGKNNETSLLKKQMETYLCVEMLAELFSADTTRPKVSDYIEQMSRALLVCDLLLTEEEYWQSYNQPHKTLSSKVLNHGADIIAQFPRADFLAPPFVALILNHHEKPDGTGYPAGKNCVDLNIYTSISIIAEFFISGFIQKKMKMNAIEPMIDQVNNTYKKYFNTELERALQLFNIVMKNEKNYFGDNIHE